LSVEERAKYFSNVGGVLRLNVDNYAKIITTEMGKPIRQARNEVQKCAWLCDYYAENAARLLKDELVDIGVEKSYVTFEPLGVIFGIMPWNFPFWQIFRFAVPAMCGGNVCVVNHASNVSRSALEIEKVFLEAGFQKHIFKTLLIDSKIAMQIIAEDRVNGVSLTGSITAGLEIGRLVGGIIKPLVLELGGSDPFIVLEDTDIERAAQIAMESRFINNGQSCIAAKRFIVVEDVAVDFIEAFKINIQKLKIGDPMDEKTDIGPLAKKEFVHSLEKVLKYARKKGAEPQTYGKKCGKGFFFNPTILFLQLV
jgi:succinate-semialdehyde dehydrogenase/glutarate-semialdehyde dehydrogenase